MTLKHRNSTRPPKAPARAFSDLDGILMDYVLDDGAAKAPRKPRRAEAVEHFGRVRWSFEQAALRQSQRRRIERPWFVEPDEERVA